MPIFFIMYGKLYCFLSSSITIRKVTRPIRNMTPLTSKASSSANVRFVDMMSTTLGTNCNMSMNAFIIQSVTAIITV